MQPELLRVLVLEDDTNMREILCETLEDAGYTVDSATAGRQAVEKVSRQSFDLLVLDVRMEGMSGLEAFSLMKQQGAELACLVITGYATEEDSIRAIRLGVGDYLRKPFEMRELLSSLARVSAAFLRQREQRQREHALARLAEWLSADLPAAQIAARVARSLGLGEPRSLELHAAAALHAEPRRENAPEGVRLALDHYRERWDGAGPLGLRGEDIPLEGRILALALAAAEEPRPAELARKRAGVVDPFLLEYLELGDGSRQAVRLLGLARAFLESGDSEAASSTLREAENCQPSPAVQTDIQLARLSLAPPAELLAGCQQLIQKARASAHAQLECALLLQEKHPGEALRLLQEVLLQLSDPADRARAELAVWKLDRAPHGWSPEETLDLLSSALHERSLSLSLPWLFPALIGWWSKLPGAHRSQRLLRSYSSLLPAQLGRLGGPEKSWLLDHIQGSSWAQPFLRELAGDGDAALRSRAQAAQRAQSGQPAAAPLLRIRSFGTFEVSVGGEPVPDKSYRGSRNKYFLAYLAAAGRHQGEDKLLDLFWSEDSDKGKKGLYNVLASLRKALRPNQWQGEVDYLYRHRGQLGLNPDMERWHDLEEFERDRAAALAALTKGDSEQARACWRRALPLCAEPFLDGCYMDWALNQRTVLEAQRIEGLLSLAELDLQAGAADLAVDSARCALLMDDCNQKAYLSCMRAYLHQSRPADVIRCYETAARCLKVEMGLEPSLELFELFQRARLLC